MDHSKLPRLSNTADAAASQAPSSPSTGACSRCGVPLRAGARFCDHCGSAIGAGAAPAQPLDVDTGLAAWISLGIGIIILFLFPNLLKYLTHPGTTAFDATDLATGAVIPYAHSAFIWPDIGVSSFAVLLIVEGLVLFAVRRRPAFLLVCVLAGLVAAVNGFAIIYAYNILGFQVMCAIAFLFAVIIAAFQWRLFRSTRA